MFSLGFACEWRPVLWTFSPVKFSASLEASVVVIVALSSHLPSAAAEEDLVWITLEPQHHRPLTSLVLSSRRSASNLRLQRSELDLVVKHMLRLLVLAPGEVGFPLREASSKITVRTPPE